MLFGLEGAVDFNGNAVADPQQGYPHTVVAQPNEVPGKDRQT
jgi:hypothetical protein